MVDVYRIQQREKKHVSGWVLCIYTYTYFEAFKRNEMKNQRKEQILHQRANKIVWRHTAANFF